MFYLDPLYLVFALPALLLSILASGAIRYFQQKYNSVHNLNGLTGIDIVNKVAQKYNLQISLEVVDETLGDHYNPGSRVVALSREVAYGKTIASVAIAAHEMGHALQHHQGSMLMRLRTVLVPAVNLGSNLGYFLFIIGIILNFAGFAWLGVFLFSGTTLFSFVTLPIEFDASNRALNFLKSSQSLYADELSGAKSLLRAAAFTYVAATLQSLGQLIYFVLRARGIDRRE